MVPQILTDHNTSLNWTGSYNIKLKYIFFVLIHVFEIHLINYPLILGTKHIDPDTGLIYFKYDFGYEFGVILPGEGKSIEIPQPKKTIIQPPKRSSDIELPVYHETTNKSKQTAHPKKVPQSKNVKWEPTSESEMSEIEGDFKKRQTLHPEYSMRWDQASASPVSLSPSLPSCSPAFNSFLTGSSGILSARISF